MEKERTPVSGFSPVCMRHEEMKDVACEWLCVSFSADGILTHRERKQNQPALAQDIVLKTAWAIVLRAYTGLEAVAFTSKGLGATNSLHRVEFGDGCNIIGISQQLETEHTDPLDARNNTVPEDGSLYTAVVSKQPYTDHAVDSEMGEYNLILDLQLDSSKGDSSPDPGPSSSDDSVSDYENEIKIHYRRSHFGPSRVSDIASSLRKAIAAVIDNSEQLVSDLDLISDSDREQIHQWNEANPPIVEESVEFLIRRQAQLTPDTLAIAGWDRSLTHKELDDFALRLASFLVDLGVGPDVLVPFCFDKSTLAVVVMLGVLKAGGGYVALDPSFPDNRISAIITNAKSTIVLSSVSYAPKLKCIIDATFVVEFSFLEQLPAVQERTWPAVRPEHLAYAIFTSGSTGTPKGILIENRSVSTMVMNNSSKLGISQDSRVLQFASYTFDASVMEIVIPLVHGGCIHVPSQHERLNDLAGYMQRNAINWTFLTPTVAALLQPKDLPTLKTIHLGAEAPRQDVFDAWCDSVAIYNLYGPSECTVMASFCKMSRHKPLKTIGYGEACRLWIVDRQNSNRLCPIGACGELLIEGHIVGRGYLNDSVKTQASFIQSPSWLIDAGRSGRVYRTGDLVKYNPDGSILYLGRIDNQIKLHGLRIEIGDIESHLTTQASIRHNAVILPKSGLLQNKLVCVLSLVHLPEAPRGSNAIIPANPEDTDRITQSLSNIKESLKSKLPPYMMPTTWVVVMSLPLSSSGKIDKKATQAFAERLDAGTLRQISSTEADKDSRSFEQESEKQIIRLLAHVLNIAPERIKPRSSFFNLGGDSITAMQLVAKCRAVGIALKVQDIMKNDTVAEISQSAKSLRVSSISKTESFHTLFGLTPIQQLYFERIRNHSGETQPPPFIQAHMIRFTWRVSVKEVKRAVDQIVERHSLLAERYSQDADGTWRQFTVPPKERKYHFGAHDVQDRSTVWPICAKSHDLLTDIRGGPLFAADIFNIGHHEQIIFFIAHHLIVDIMSWRIIFRDLETFLTTDTPMSPPLPFQTWTRLQAEHAHQHLSPEKVLLHTVSPPDFDYWGMNNVHNVFADVIGIQFQLDKDMLQILFNSYRQSLRADPIDIYLASLLYSFNAIFRDRDAPALFIEGHGREPWDPQLDVSETVGWFTTFYPLQVQDRVDFDQLVRLVKTQRINLPGKGYSYFTSRFLNEAGRKRFSNHSEMELNLNYTGHYQQLERSDSLLQFDHFGLDDIIRNQLDSQPRLSLFDLEITVLAGNAIIACRYNRRMKHQEKIAQWMSSWEKLILQAVTNLQQVSLQYNPTDFPMMSLTAAGLDRVNEIAGKLPKDCEIEDMYPCSPIQQGILLAQARSRDIYKSKFLFEVVPVSGLINVPRLLLAWEQAIRRHPMLRTIIVDNVSHAPYDQIVLSSFKPQLQMMVADNDDVEAILKACPSYETDEVKPAYQLTITSSPSGTIYLGLSISHALFDGTSNDILAKDIALAYDDKLQSTTGTKYRTYIQYLQSNSTDDALTYWTSYLQDVNSTYFPCLNEGIEREPELKTVEVELTEYMAAMNDFCRTYKVTVANVFLVVWGLVLRMINNADQVNFGYLTSGRDIDLDDVESAIGPYINMLICRMDMNDSSRLIDLVEKRREEYLESLPYQHTSLADIQHNLKLSKERLFNTALSFQRVLDSAADDNSISIRECTATDPSEYDVSVHVGLWKHKLLVNIDYTTSVLSTRLAPNITNVLKNTLAAILHSPETTIGDLSLIGERDLALIQRWNLPEPVVTNNTLHGLIANTTARYPAHPAIASMDEVVSYVELDSLSTNLAHHLVAQGLRPDTFVPVCLEKSSLAIVCLLAVLKAGGAFVPIDRNAPKVRAESIVSSLGCALALCTPATAKILKSIVGNMIVVSKSLLHQLAEARDPPQCDITGSNPAYVMFTSGSTGTPKGVVIEHHAISSSIISLMKYFHFGIYSRVFQFTAYTFDGSLFEIFATLISGGCVCTPSDGDSLEDIPRAIRNLNVNTAFFTPSVLRLLNPDDIPGLQTLLVGGEAIGSDNVETWGQRVEMHCIYGPTEASIWCVCCRLGTENVRFDVIGRGIGIQTWVVLPNNHNMLAPVGCIGELILSGPGLARGYLNNAEKTAQAFIDGPNWLPQDNIFRRVYKTGDLVRYNSNGTITFLCRKDTQVKLRGQRLELGEIEHHVKSRLKQVKHLAVDIIAPKFVSERRAIAVFIYLESNAETGIKSGPRPIALDKLLREKLSTVTASLFEVLPSYMIPTYWISISSMPHTTSGKLDRKVLVEIGSALSSEELKAYSANSSVKRSPSTDMQHTLHGLWQDVLRLPGEEIGVDDNFFQLGGDSILAMKLAAMALKVNVSVNVSQIFQHPNLSALANLAEKAAIDPRPSQSLRPFELLDHIGDVQTFLSRAAETCHVNRDAIDDVYPCTPVQEGLMAISIHRPRTYMTQRVYRLPLGMDLDQWKNAWQRTVDASDILRTRIINTEDHGSFQTVLRQELLLWRNSDDLEKASRDALEEPVCYGEPLIRYDMVQDNSIYYFIWTAHHSLYDGWSLPLVFELFEKIFKGESFGIPPAFSGYISYIMKTGSESVGTFWAKQFLGERPVSFPELPSPKYAPTASALVKHKLKISTKTHSGVVISNILRAAWSILTSRYTESDDVVFGATLSGRTAAVENIDKMLGPTISTIPVRVRVDSGKSVRDFLEDVQRQATDMIPFEHFGLQNIARLSDGARAAVGFQTLTVIQPVASETQPLGVELLPHNAELNAYSMVLECQLQENGVDVHMLYDPYVLPAERVEIMAYHFENVVRQLREEPDQKVGSIDLFTEHDQQIIEAWNKSYFEKSKFVNLTVADLVADLGFGSSHGMSFWITNLSNTDKLAPVGVMGELLFGVSSDSTVCNEGTASELSCIPAPAWWLGRTNGFHKRNLFKTGYTAQFDCTGDIKVFGVKGSQVLIQGHRVDLAMVERHIMKSHQAIQRVSVRKVVFKGQQTLASILEFQQESTANSTLDSTNGVLALTPEIVAALKKIQKSISKTLKSHAVPSLYIPLEEIPLEEPKGWLRNILSSLSREDLHLYTLNSADEHGLS